MGLLCSEAIKPVGNSQLNHIATMKLSLIDRIDDQIRRLRRKIEVLRENRAKLLADAARMTSVHPLVDSVIADRCKLPQNYGDLSLRQRKIIGSDKLMGDSLFPLHECELLQRRVNGSDKERLALEKAIAWVAESTP